MSFETFTNISSLPSDLKRPLLSYIGLLFGLVHKCYSIDIPLNSLSLSLKIRQNIFYKGIRPGALGFTVVTHYPNQFLSAFDTIKNGWPSRKKKANIPFSMYFRIKWFEAIIRRNTKNNPCNENWKRDDLDIFEKSIAKNKCKAPYDIWNSNSPFCDNKETIFSDHASNQNLSVSFVTNPKLQCLVSTSYVLCLDDNRSKPYIDLPC